MLDAAGSMVAAGLFAAVGWFLTLIAKFYRLKFKRGPSGGWMQIHLILLVTGLLVGAFPGPALMGPFSAVLTCVGGGMFSWTVWILYRTMMSINS